MPVNIPTDHRTLRDVRLCLVAAALATAVLSVYWQVGRYPFVDGDDGQYVSGNPFVLRGLTLDGFAWAFSTFHAANWHPLTWLSHMLDVELFGPDPGWHHRMNVVYHLVNTELLFLVLWRMTGVLWQCAFVAALFGVHPLHVESVAWVAERKDVLSTLFWMLTMVAYLRYVRRPGVGRYLPVAVAFALGLMCKPMLVTLPFVLLLLDGWPLGRLMPRESPGCPSWRSCMPVWSRLLREKAPMLGLSAMSCAVTYLAQDRGRAMMSFGSFPLGSRVSNALVSYVGYLGKAVWPSSLAVFYPHPATIHADIPLWVVSASVLLLLGLSAMVCRQAIRRPYLAVGWLWYAGTLVPVIGLVQVGWQALADRYTYVPLIGIFLAVAWGVSEESKGWRHRKPALAAAAVLLLVALSISARLQAGYWRDSVTLFSRAVEVTKRNWFALNNLGVSHDRIGQHDKAISCYRDALQIRPDYDDAWSNLGGSHGKLGQYRQAIDCYRKALRINPNHFYAWNNLGAVYSKLGQYHQAILCFREALRNTPDFSEAWNNLGEVHYTLGQHQQAIDCYSEALRIRPDYPEAWNNLGAVHYSLGQYQKAIDCFNEALRIMPNLASARNNLFLTHRKIGAPGSFPGTPEHHQR